MFEKGQTVYLANRMLGWFDKSLKRAIPENAACVIENSDELSNTYSVRFIGKYEEFGSLLVDHKNLKTDND
jgi:hypothetical protein